jgi:hypothetical protein
MPRKTKIKTEEEKLSDKKIEKEYTWNQEKYLRELNEKHKDGYNNINRRKYY